jgi:hypothetical protein
LPRIEPEKISVQAGSGATAPRWSAAALAGMTLAAAIAGVFLVHAAYLALTLAPLPMELALPRDRIVPVRGVSLALSALGLAAALALGRRLLSDAPAAPFLALPLVLLPPFTAVAVTATPAALAILLTLLVLHAGPHSGATTMAAAASTLAVIHPLGPGLAVLALAVAGALSGWSRPWRGAAAFVAAILAGLAFVAFTGVLPRRELSGWQLDLSAAGQGGVVRGLALPYALVPAMFALSALALRADAVRARLGTSGVRGAVAAMLATAAGVVALVIAEPPGHLLTAAALVVPLALPAAAPLIAWVRWVMPTVTSLAAWILFPVIMYAGFWLALGPVDADRFPYAYRQTADHPTGPAESPPPSGPAPAGPPLGVQPTGLAARSWLWRT